MHGAFARLLLRTQRSGRSLIRRALIFPPNGRHRIRRGEAAAIRKPEEPRALPVEWLAEREHNQTQNRQDCGVPGTTGGRRSSAEVEQNTSPHNIYLASLFIRKCIKQPKHSTPCLDVTPRRSAPSLVIQLGGGGWSLDPVSTLLKWMLRLCHFVCQLLLKCLISRFTLVLKLLDILTPLWSVYVAFLFFLVLSSSIFCPPQCSGWKDAHSRMLSAVAPVIAPAR